MEVIMTLIRKNYFPAANLFDDLFARDLWNWGSANNSSTNTTLPAVNIRETAVNFIVEMAAPGMKKEDFKVELDGNTLTISSEKKREHEEKEDERYAIREFSYQSFQRSFELSKDVVDVDSIQAKYENGVLHLVIPKKEDVRQRPPRMIHIS